MSVVVTGAASGIGAACVEAFQAEGEHVVGLDVKSSSLADEHLEVDLSEPRFAPTVVDALDGHEIRALVNCAAAVTYTAAVETGVDAWDHTMATNLRAPFLLSVALYPQLEEAGGAVVNVSSVHAIATSPGVAAYAASKGGLAALTRALAIEWAPHVRVNCVLPGAADTQMLADGLIRSGSSVEDLGRRHPLGRVADPAEIAAAVVYLARSTFITGSSLVVDGGATARLSTE